MNTNEIEAGKRASIIGRVCAGLGEGKYFTQLPWFKMQLAQKLGIDPYPGTLNLSLDSLEARQRIYELRQSPGVDIIPEGDFCPGVCYRVLMRGGIEAAAVFPKVSGYPDDKLEIVSEVNLKQALGIQDGDVISVVIET